MRLRGCEVSLREFATGSGYGPPRERRLAVAELRALAGRMARLAPGRLPVNLWAPAYVDLTLAVLDHRVAVQARRFAGMTAAGQGAAQRDFDRLLAGLRELAAPPAAAAPQAPGDGG